jgi:hypothetical protein
MAQRLAFLADWLDPASGVKWRFQVFFYLESAEIELVGVHAAEPRLHLTPPPGQAGRAGRGLQTGGGLSHRAVGRAERAGGARAQLR